MLSVSSALNSYKSMSLVCSKTHLFVIAIQVVLITLQALPIERCPQFRDQPPGSTATYNGKCYIFYNRQPLNLRESLAFCRSRGGTLVDESNPALQGFISWELWRRHRYNTITYSLVNSCQNYF